MSAPKLKNFAYRFRWKAHAGRGNLQHHLCQRQNSIPHVQAKAGAAFWAEETLFFALSLSIIPYSFSVKEVRGLMPGFSGCGFRWNRHIGGGSLRRLQPVRDRQN